LADLIVLGVLGLFATGIRAAPGCQTSNLREFGLAVGLGAATWFIASATGRKRAAF
jgi:hypothetical protein